MRDGPAAVAVADDPWDDAARWSADEALTQLYVAHWRGLVRLAWLLLHDQAESEEVVQDAFVAVHRRWRRLADHDRALAYLRVCVVNGARSVLRHRGVERRWADAGRPGAGAPGTPRGGEPQAPSAEDAVLAADQRGIVVDVLRALPTRQREVLVLRYYLDLSEAEIAEALGISRGAVKSHAHRGLATLRTTMAAVPALRPGQEGSS